MLVLLALSALLLAPGYLLLLLIVPAEDWLDPILQLVLIMGLSVSVWPLILMLTTSLGLTLTPVTVAGLLGLVLLAILGCLWQLDGQPLPALRSRLVGLDTGMFGGLLLLTLALRVWQIRGLVVPAWVDGVHHTMIAQLVVEQGRVPADYGPYLDAGGFIYHFGFHALAACLAWLTGLPVTRAVLLTGQVLNALVGAGVYGLAVTLVGGGRAWSGRRRPAVVTGLAAMGVVGAVSWMPAYYVTWGRYTQLTGLVVLPVAVMLTLWWLESGRRWALALGAVTVAGLGLIHYRVLVFYAAFVAALLLYEGVAGLARSSSDAGGVTAELRDRLTRALALAVFAALLISPWIVRVVRVLTERGAWPGLEAGPDYTAAPYEFLRMPRNLPLMLLAVWGVTLGYWHRHRGMIVLSLWLLILMLIAALGLAAVPASAVGISLFLPAVVYIGYLISEGLGQIAPRWRVVVVGGLLVTFVWGAMGMATIVNPATVLFTPDDVEAVEWVKQHTSPDARFLINNRTWQGNIRVGVDAGYWLSVLADRETVPPPVLYVLGSPARVAQTNQISALTSSDHLDAGQLREAGITHVFLGTRGGGMDPAGLLADTAFELLYADGEAWVFGVNRLDAVIVDGVP